METAGKLDRDKSGPKPLSESRSLPANHVKRRRGVCSIFPMTLQHALAHPTNSQQGNYFFKPKTYKAFGYEV